MPALLPFLLFLHVLSISIWIAAALWLPGDVKRTLALGGAHADALAARIRPQLGLDVVAAVATFATGILVMWAQGWERPRTGVAIGIALAVARVFVLAALGRSARAAVGRLQAGETVAPSDPAVRRIGMLSGIAHLLWAVALAGMVLPY